MKVLIVAMAQSVHTARWVAQAAGQDIEVHLFPVEDGGLHPDIDGVWVHDAWFSPPRRKAGLNRVICDVLPSWWDELVGPPTLGIRYLRRAMSVARPRLRDTTARLSAVIRRLRPSVIHSHEIVKCGGLVWKTHKLLGGLPCPWLASNWGSELYMLAKLSGPGATVRNVLDKCDFLTGECCRDSELAREYGFAGQVLDIIPNAGGIDLSGKYQHISMPKTSSRIMVAIKGYQGWAGRGLVGLRAIEMCKDLFRERGFRVTVYSADSSVAIAAELLAQSTGIQVEVICPSDHPTILRMHGQARVSIGLSISDAISTSVLEAMAMGSFPIQSRTSCAGEDGWLRDGESGFLVHPDDPNEVADALRRALTDDTLVDNAAERNRFTVQARLAPALISGKILKLYERAAGAVRVGSRFTSPDLQVWSPVG